MYSSVNDIDWASWVPEQRATLMFVIKDGQILLIHKKTGFGKGKVSGPGGKIEQGETPEQCAIRETQEELCITPDGVSFAGELCFQFMDGFSIHGYVYTASDFKGIPEETAEARPMWSDVDKIPYQDMWEDDYTWIPFMLEGTPFVGRYLFEGDRMLDAKVDV